MAAVLAVMGNEAEAMYPVREALTAAMLAEHQGTGDSLWSSALLLAYYPMLNRLRGRLVSARTLRVDLDQVVVTAFLSAVKEVPLHLNRLPMRLRQRTERAVFSFLRKEWAEHKPAAGGAELAEFGSESIMQRRLPPMDEFMLDLSLLLERALRQGFALDELELIERTVLRGELLRTYVERVVPDDEEERRRTYQRLKRRRSRTIKRLRELLNVSPLTGP
jgi:hypothetical protein